VCILFVFLKKTDWGVTPCSFVEMHRRLGRTRCLHLQGPRKMEATDFPKPSVTMCSTAAGCQSCSACMAPSWVLFWCTAVSGPSLVFTQLFRHFVTGSCESGWNYTTKISASPSVLLLRRSLAVQPICVSQCVRGLLLSSELFDDF